MVLPVFYPNQSSDEAQASQPDRQFMDFKFLFLEMIPQDPTITSTLDSRISGSLLIDIARKPFEVIGLGTNTSKQHDLRSFDAVVTLYDEQRQQQQAQWFNMHRNFGASILCRYAHLLIHQRRMSNAVVANILAWRGKTGLIVREENLGRE